MPPPANLGAGSPTTTLLNTEARYLTAKNLLSMRRARAPIGKATIRRELNEAIATGSIVVRARYYHVHADQEDAAIAVATAQLTSYLAAHGTSKRIPIIRTLGWSAEFLSWILECNTAHIPTSRGAEGHLLIHPPHTDAPAPGPDSTTELHALAERILSHLQSLDGTDNKGRQHADTLTGLTHRLGTTRDLALQAAEHLAARGDVILEQGLLINVKLVSAVTMRTYTIAEYEQEKAAKAARTAAPVAQPTPATEEAAAPVLVPNPVTRPSALPLVSRYLRRPARTPATPHRQTPVLSLSASQAGGGGTPSAARRAPGRPHHARPRRSRHDRHPAARPSGRTGLAHRHTPQHHPSPFHAAAPPKRGTGRQSLLRLRASRTGAP